MWLDRFRSSAAPAKAVEAPPSYQQRATRFLLDVPVSLIEDGTERVGQCVNVSESGLLATFDQPPELWTDAQLTLQAGEHHLSIKARVARVQDRQAAFAFAIHNENDRATVSILVNSVSDRPVPEDESPALA